LSTFLQEIFTNHVLWTSIFSWFAAGLIKVLLYLGKNKRVNALLFMSSGGMPSSHTAFVMAMTTTIGFAEGFQSSMFAVSAVLCFVVMYDATGVRRAAGKQAAVLNMIVESLQDTGISLDKKLKELLGHSPVEVGAGALLGIIIGTVSSYLFT